MEKTISRRMGNSAKDFHDLIASPGILPLLALSKREKQVLHMRLWENIGLDDIGKILNISGERVRHIYSRVIADIRKKLEAICTEVRTIPALKAENELLKQKNIILPSTKITKSSDDGIHHASIDILLLDTRTSKILNSKGIKTVEDVLQWSEQRLLKCPKMGVGSITRLKKALARYDLFLSGI